MGLKGAKLYAIIPQSRQFVILRHLQDQGSRWVFANDNNIISTSGEAFPLFIIKSRIKHSYLHSQTLIYFTNILQTGLLFCNYINF